MSNLAYKIQQKQVQEKKQKVQQQPQTVVVPRSRVTRGEKLLWVVLTCCFLMASIMVVSNYASIYNTNTEIQKIEAKQNQFAKTNEELSFTVKELSSPDRIMQVAKDKLGMTFSDKNVQVVRN
ncbi:cell division protein FtsL [Pseudalkalibacillus caeni]|uniref:Cell division protein FtsL n=1 Tax=Exobacillus caeni TaxID=2574798 RepID=A0A5R9EYG0_9BACL|nr:cell division protein FtsL [Pseudalkalibacillus caeni]TLS35236.1 cell division protein FtsL [Pseudalkalibacillus caeni]